MPRVTAQRAKPSPEKAAAISATGALCAKSPNGMSKSAGTGSGRSYPGVLRNGYLANCPAYAPKPGVGSVGVNPVTFLPVVKFTT